MSESNANNARNLADLLIEQELLSAAQAELAVADQEINDIPLEEILLVRGWITEEKLYGVAPWLKPGSKEKAPWESGAQEAVKGPPPKPANKEEWKPSVVPNVTTPPSTPSSGTKSGGAGANEKPAAKQEMPKPPQRPSGAPTVESSPVKTNQDQNLKSYKELLKKILATGQE